MRLLKSIKRRPICVLCLLFVLVMFLAEGMGFSLIKGNPLPETVQKWIEKHPKGTVCGTVYWCETTEYSKIIYLKKTYLIYKSEKIPIGNLKVYIDANLKVPSGAVIVVSGNMRKTECARNPGGFDEQEYYACQHIFYIMKYGKIKRVSSKYSVNSEFLSYAREYLSDVFIKNAGDDAAIFQAMLLGVKKNLEQEKKTLYQMGGIIHILAISGLHINMIGVSTYELLKKIGMGMKTAGFLSLCVMIEYGMMTGNGVSTIRAVSMFVLNIGAQLLGRSYDMPTALAMAAILILMESPAYLYSSSFLLSFGAVIAIGLIVPMMEEYFEIKNGGVKALISSAMVQLITLPIVLYTYGETSIAGIFLNLLVLPTVHIVMVSGAIGCLVSIGNIGISAARWILIPGRLLLRLYESFCSYVGRFSFFTWIAGEPEWWQILLYYVILSVAFLLMDIMRNKRIFPKIFRSFRMKQKHNIKLISGIILLIAIVCGIFCIKYEKKTDIEIVCLDVGQGDCIYIRTEENKNFLIDCGSTDKSKVGQYNLLPFLKNKGVSYIDGIFISHTDQDHVNGIIELLSIIADHMTAIRVGKVILPNWRIKDDNFYEIEELAIDAGVEIIYADAGDEISTENMIIKVLHPEKGSTGINTNENGLVLEVEYKGFRGLFMGDAGSEVEKKLLKEFENVDFLKIGHHGSKYSTCNEFLEQISPEIAVISCGQDNSYGHPAKETIDRLKKSGCQVEYTMKNGAIKIYMEKNKIGVERYVDK